MARPEVLAPAGSPEALAAALAAGADAVYFGLDGFNARARAANFAASDLAERVAQVHTAGARAYVTLNTLVFDRELGALERAVRACAAAGVDAVIVQDLGVARLVGAIAPELAIHASTQMTCTDAGSVKFAESLGAERVVVARELSAAQIGAIAAEVDAELEVFVHGALCVSYSGQCLTSEAIGGRSANRGACAQACRLPYDLVVDGQVRDLGPVAYLLSPEDLEATEQIGALAEAGVRSLKIEGRLKGPEYVAATTRLYRAAVGDVVGAGPNGDLPGLRRQALQTFTRGSGPGFLAGIDHQRLVEGTTCDHRGLPLGRVTAVRQDGDRRWLVIAREAGADVRKGDGLLVEGQRAGDGEVGGRVWACHEAGTSVQLWLGPERDVAEVLVGRRVWKTNDPAVSKAIRQATDGAPRLARLDVVVRGRAGASAVFEARTPRGESATFRTAEVLQPADRHPLDAAILADKLGQLGATPFTLGDVCVELEGDLRLPVRVLKEARRALVAQLLEQRQRAGGPTTDASAQRLVEAATAAIVEHPTPPGGLFVLCRSLEQARAAIAAGADGLYLDFLELTGTGDAFRELRPHTPFLGVAPPRIRKPGEEKIDRYLWRLAPDAFLVRGLGTLGELAPHGVVPGSGAPLAVGDFSLNVTNRVAAHEVLGRGLGAFTPAYDLDGAQLVELLGGGVGPRAEVVVHHPMPLFHTEHCVFAALLSEGRDHRTCGRPCERHRVALRDRAGAVHPVIADVGCRNTVFHGAAQSAADLVPRLTDLGVRRFRIELVQEGPEAVGDLVRLYRGLVDGSTTPRAAWGALRRQGGVDDQFGVVRGSLRVLQ